jgi:hypothetical protein
MGIELAQNAYYPLCLEPQRIIGSEVLGNGAEGKMSQLQIPRQSNGVIQTAKQQTRTVYDIATKRCRTQNSKHADIQKGHGI